MYVAKDTELVSGTKISLLRFSGPTLFRHSCDSTNFPWANFNWFSEEVKNSISCLIKQNSDYQASEIT